jgi:nucleoid-associated protein
MPIDALITHHIACDTESDATVRLGSEVLPADERAAALVDALKSSFFSRLTREHGCFAAEDEPAPLPRALQAFAGNELGFVELTTQLMTHWRSLLAQDKPAIDADVICFSEKQADRPVFYLLAAGYKTAFTVNDDQAIVSTRYLDLGSGLFGIKVDLHEWLTAKHYAYLSLVPPQGNRKLADSFLALTGFTRGLDKADSTEAFLAGVEAFSRQVDPDQLDSYRNQVVDYCAQQEQRDAPIDLGELSRAVEGIDGDSFSRFMADYTPDDESALMMDRRSLRRYVKFAGREKDLAISFSSSQLNSRVHYNPDKDTLSIDGIPRGLREQLLKHLNS